MSDFRCKKSKSINPNQSVSESKKSRIKTRNLYILQFSQRQHEITEKKKFRLVHFRVLLWSSMVLTTCHCLDLQDLLSFSADFGKRMAKIFFTYRANFFTWFPSYSSWCSSFLSSRDLVSVCSADRCSWYLGQDIRT